MLPLGDRKRWLVGRGRTLKPQALRDIERSPDGRWTVQGPRPLVSLVPDDEGPVPSGDIRLEVQVSGAESPLQATLLIDVGAGFARGVQIPVAVARTGGAISAVVTVPASTVALGLDPGPLRAFQFDTLRLTELSAVGAVLSHAVPQLKRLLRNPTELAVLLGRAARLLRYRGLHGVVERLRRGTQRQLSDEGYEGWARRYVTLGEAQRSELRASLGRLSDGPTFSLILSSRQAPESEMRRTLDALARQIYPRWELVLADEATSEGLREFLTEFSARDRIRWAPEPEALATARGEFVARLEPGDTLTEDALFAVATLVAHKPDCALVYTDTDGDAGKGHTEPAFKPEWSPELLRSFDYIGRAVFFHADAVRSLGGWSAGPGDAPQYEMLLRYTAGLPAERIAHLPAVLMHLVPERAPTTEEVLEGVRAVQASLDDAHRVASVESGRRRGTHHVEYAVPNPPPLVTVVIPTRDHLPLLSRCIKSLQLTTYRPLELLVVDNDSSQRRTRLFLDELESKGTARVLRYPHPFNFSAMNNLAAREARGEVLCLLNNDVEVIDAGWLTEMVGLALQPDVGAVGAKLLYPDNTVQHAGTVAGLFGVAAHGYLREPREAEGYLLQLQTTREVSALTAACMVLRRDTYLDVGGLDEAELPVAFNDVDLCFRLLRAGYRNLWTPYAELYHRESASRGTDERGADRRRFLQEESVMRKRWGALIDGDPYYSPNLSLDSNVPRPAWPPRAVLPWRVAE